MKIKEALLDGYQKVVGPHVELMQYCRAEYIDIADELPSTCRGILVTEA